MAGDDDDGEQPQSLRELFSRANAARQSIEATSPTASPSYAADLDATLSLYEQLVRQAAALALFSPNEAADDIATSSLPYLVAEFHIAELRLRTPYAGPSSRRDVLTRARAAFERFLALVDGYGLVSGDFARMLERYRDDATGFAVAAGTDAAARRENKIRNFRAEKELRERLALLKSDARYRDHADEELVRTVYFAEVASAVHATFQSLDSLNRELPILAEAPSSDQTEDRRWRDNSLNTSIDDAIRLDQPLRQQQAGGGPLLSQKGKPLQPFTLVGSRADLARGVFRSGHNLPTMSIDEYLEEERRRGGILEGGTEAAKPPVDEDDMDAADRETYKAREWDDFKDANPRGSGNTLNMG